MNPIEFISTLQASYFAPDALAHVAHMVNNVPPLRAQHDDYEHLAYLHYLNNTTDEHWYITELNPETMQAFGWVYGTEQAGYENIDLARLLSTMDVGFDTRFKPVLVDVLEKVHGVTTGAGT